MGELKTKSRDNFELTIKLKQHSPLIHFQFDQAGATLRATEVKPKLDRFLTKRLGEDKVKDWRIGDTKALDYSLHFSSPNNRPIDIGPGTEYDIYYGNMGEDTKKVKAVMADADVTMKIVCNDPDLMDELKKNVNDFFISTNFGRMQDKGFGSFTVVNGDVTPKHIGEVLCKEYGAKACYVFDGKDKPFKRIKTVYGIMKSGLNFGGRYRRSLLFLYMHSLGFGNEKAFLKQMGMVPVKGRSYHPNATTDKPHYVRALLGVGDTLSFQNIGGGKTPVTISSDSIKRLSSPILFKIINDRVYFVGGRIDERIFGQSFKFESWFNRTNYSNNLSVPSVGEDFLDGFLSYAVKQLNDPAPSDRGTALSGFRDFHGETGEIIKTVYRKEGE